MKNRQMADGERSAIWIKSTQNKPFFGLNENICHLPSAQPFSIWTILDHPHFNEINDLATNRRWQVLRKRRWKKCVSIWHLPSTGAACSDISRWLRRPSPLTGGRFPRCRLETDDLLRGGVNF